MLALFDNTDTEPRYVDFTVTRSERRGKSDSKPDEPDIFLPCMPGSKDNQPIFRLSIDSVARRDESDESWNIQGTLVHRDGLHAANVAVCYHTNTRRGSMYISQ